MDADKFKSIVRGDTQRESLFTPNKSALAVATALAFASPAWSNPTGGQVVSGQAAINAPTTTSVVIDQASNKAIINWNSFSIGANESVRFNQPSASSIALNRVLGSSGSEIFGSLTANGQIFLINPNGVLMGRGAQISAAGFLASSLGITDADFLGGRYSFTRGTVAGSVINEGTITTSGGYTALIAPQVENHGLISARLGSVGLAAGDRVTLDFTGDGMMRLGVDQAALSVAIRNSGTLTADGGRVILSAKSANALLDTVLNNDGVIRADTLLERDGVIALESSAGIASNSGSLLARGLNANETGGTISVTAPNVLLTSTAVADASGTAGGGNIFIGGNYQGKGPLANAQNTLAATGALLKADATTNGNGGQVIVWADRNTAFGGAISATGGPEGGNGGKAEVSGRQNLDFNGTADLTAPRGNTGTLLLDPSDITINNGSDDTNQTGGDPNTITGKSNASALNVAVLVGALNTANVIVDATGGGSLTGNGTITVDTSVTSASGKSLDLKASKDITLNASLNVGTGTLNLTSVDGGPITQNAGAVITANTLTLSNKDASATLNEANVITKLGAVALGTGALSLNTVGSLIVSNPVVATGGITLNTNGPLSMTSGTLNAGTGNVSLTTTGTGNPISQTGGSIIADTLTLTTTDANALLPLGGLPAGNSVTNLGTTLLGNGVLNLKNSGNLTVTGAVSATGGITLNTGGALTVNNTLSAGAGTASLTTTGAGNAITQNATGVITADTLTLNANANANLNTATNTITKLGATALGSGALTLKNAGSLTVTSAVGASGGITLRTGGALVANQTLSAGNGDLTLISDTGTVTANNYTVGAGKTFTVQSGAPLIIGDISNSSGNITAPNVALIADTISFNGTIDVSASPSGKIAIAPMTSGKTIVVGNSATAGDLIIDQAALGKLTSAKELTIGQTGPNATPASTSTAGLITVGTATVVNPTLNLFSGVSSAPAIVQDGALTLGNPAGTGTLTLNTAGGDAALNNSGNALGSLGPVSLSAGALNLKNTANLTVGGSVTAFGGITLETAGALSLNQPLIASSGNVSLTTTGGSGNNIAQSNTGVITAGTLALTTANANATLNGATNAIASLGPADLGAGALSLLNQGGLTVTGAVAASSGITLNAGGPLFINQPLNAGTGNLSLTTSGGGNSEISQTAAGVLTAGTLGITTPDAKASLDQANNLVSNLGATSLGAGALVHKNNAPLTVSGAVTGTGGITLQTNGDLTLSNVLNSGANQIKLTTTAGNINETDTGGLQATNSLSVTTAGGNVTLSPTNPGNNTLPGFGTVNTGSGAFKYSGDTSTLSPAAISAAGSIDVTNTNSLVFTGNVAASGDINFRATNGSVSTQGGLSVTTDTGSISVRAKGNISFSDDGGNNLKAANGNLTLISDTGTVKASQYTVGNTFTVQVGPGQKLSAADVSTSTLKIKAANAVLVADEISDSGFDSFDVTGTIAFAPVTQGKPMVLGTPSAAVAGALNVPQAMLDRMTSAATLRFGQTGANAIPASTFTAGAITVGATSITNTNLNLFSGVSSGSGITQDGAITINGGAGTLGVTTAGGNVELSNGGNVVGTLGAVSTGNGTFTLNDSAGGLILTGPVSGKGIAIITTGGDLQIKGTLTDLGNTFLTNNSGSIVQPAQVTANNISNADLTISAPAGAITLTNSANALNGEVKISNGGANNVSITNSGGLILGTSSVGSGTLTVTALGGAITQSGSSAGITQAAGGGKATFNAGANAITLDKQTGNIFTGPVTLTGSDIDIRTNQKLSLTLNASGKANVMGDLDIEGTISGDLTIDALTGPTNFGPNLDTNVSGNLSLTNTDTVTQTAGKNVLVTGTTLMDASAKNASITLNEGGNHFTGAATFNGSTIQVTDSGALSATLAATDAGKLNSRASLTVSGQAKSLTTFTGVGGDTNTTALTVTNGDLSIFSNGKTIIGAGPTNVNGNFSIFTKGDVSQTGAGSQIIVGGGKFSVSSLGTDVNAMLDKANNTIATLGDMSLNKGALALNNLGALTIAGTINQAGGGYTIINDGQITQQAGSGKIDTTKITSGAATDGNVSLTAMTTLAATNPILLNADIAAGAGNVTLQATGSITQAAAGSSITASALSANATDAATTVALDSANNTFNTITGSSPGAFSARTNSNLAVGAGGVTSTNGDATLLSTGTMTLTGAASANAATGTVNLQSLAGSVTTTGAGAVAGNKAVLQAKINIDLDCATLVCAGNNIGNGGVAGRAIDGFFVLQNNTALDIGTVSALSGITSGGATLLRVKAGNLTQQNADIITAAGGLGIDVHNGSAILTAANNVTGNVGGFAFGAGNSINFRNTGGFNVGLVAIPVTGGLITDGGFGTDIASGSSVTLTSDLGAITQSGGTVPVINTNTLNVTTTNNDTTLGNVLNTITNLGTVSLGTGTFTLGNAGNLTVTGPVSASGGIAISTSGALAINKSLNAGPTGSISLSTTGAGNGIAQDANGTLITTGALVINTDGGNVMLDKAANGLGGVGPVDTKGGSFALVDTALGLTVTGPVTANGISLTTSDFLTINNTLSAGAGKTTLVTTSGVAGKGDITQSAAITTTDLSVTTVAGAIALTNVNNNISAVGNTTLNTGGASTSITNLNGLTFGNSNLGAGSLTVSTGGAVSQTGALTVNGAATINAGANAITLTNPGNDFADRVSLNNSGVNNVAITDANALIVGSSNVGSGSFTVNATGPITQTGGIITGGASTFNAGANPITLTSASNLFNRPVSLNNSGANSVAINSASILILGPSNVGSGTLDASAVLSISQTGPIIQAPGANAATFTAPLLGVSLSLDNDFTGPVSMNTSGVANGPLNVTITDVNALTVRLSTGGTSTIKAGGNLAVSGGTAGLTTTTTGVGSTTSFGLTNVTGKLNTTSSGAVIQTGVLNVTGTSSIDAGANAITLGLGNDFGSSASIFKGSSVTVNDVNALTAALTTTGLSTLTAGGDLAVSGSTSGLTTTTGAGRTTTFGLTNVTGNLNTTGSGAVIQTGVLSVTGTSSINAGASAITLGLGNDFGAGTSIFTGSTVSVNDVNALTASLTASGASTLTAGGDLTVSGSSAGLSTATSGAGKTIFGATTVSGALNTSSVGAVSQTGALTVTGTTAIAAPGNAITLANLSNDFVGPVSLTGSTIDIFDKNQLAVAVTATGSTKVTGNLTYSGTSGDLTLTATANPVGTLTLGDTVVNGDLVATAADAVSQFAGTALTVTGTANIDASANNKSITLNNAGNHFGTFATLKGSTINVADNAALNTVISGTGLATLNALTAMTVSGTAVGVAGNAGTTMTVAAAGLNGGAAPVQLVGSGDLTLNGLVSSASAGNSVVIASTAGNFINNAGAGAISVPAAGRFLIYSGSPLLDTIGGLTAPNKRYGTSFDPTFANIPFLSSGFLYRIQPALTITADSSTRTFGAANPAFTFTPAGFIAGDTAATALAGAPALTTSATTVSLGGAYAINAAAGTLVSPTNYSLTYVNGTLTVTPGTSLADIIASVTAAATATAKTTGIPLFNTEARAMMCLVGDVELLFYPRGEPIRIPLAVVSELRYAANCSGAFPSNALSRQRQTHWLATFN